MLEAPEQDPVSEQKKLKDRQQRQKELSKSAVPHHFEDNHKHNRQQQRNHRYMNSYGCSKPNYERENSPQLDHLHRIKG
jgi:hypothetical protein